MIGRVEEFEAIVTAASCAREQGCALVVEGHPGIGKTTLLTSSARWGKDNGFTVLCCAGVQCQTKVGYAAVHELVRPILGYAESLPPHQKRALLGALGLGEPVESDPLLIGVAVLGLIEEASARRPLMLIVDDAHWLDGSSLHVLTFVGRRISSAAAVLLCAARPGLDGESARLVSLPRLTLGPVDESASRALLADALAAGPTLSELAQRRVLHEAAGNPLAIAELAKAVAATDDHHLWGGTPPLPTTRRIERIFLEQLGVLPEPSRQMLALVSASDATSLTEVLDAARRVDLPETCLDPLERTGLITVDDGVIKVRHPLIRSVAYSAATLSQRSTFHRALAEATSDPAQATWQRAAASYGRDEVIATELEYVARAAGQRGANAEAAAAWRRAAMLSTTPGGRVRRLVRAIEPACRAGLTTEAINIVDEAEPLATGLDDLVELATARFTLGVTAGVAVPAIADLLALADRLADADTPEQHLARVNLVAAAAAQCRMHGLDEGDRHLVADSLHRLEVLEEPAIEVALATVEDTKYAHQFRSHATSLHAAANDDTMLLMSMGLAAESVSDLSTAQQCWDRAIRVARTSGAPSIECEALRGSARAQIISGRLPEAAMSAQTALRIATDCDMSLSMGSAAALLARAHAWRGRSADAQSALAIARQHIPVDTSLLWIDDLAWASGLLALIRHDYDEAFTELSKMARDRSSRRWAIADLTEAAVASHNVDNIGILVGEIATEAATLGSPHLLALVHRSRALLAGNDIDAEEHFRTALHDGARAEASLEYARTQLNYGQWLRRQRRIVDSRVQLSAALREFQSRDAEPWVQRTRTELRAAGVQSPGDLTPTNDVEAELTPQEMQIARLAASGLSNRQIADQIYVSHRTVAAHLYKVFPKLGISSRNQIRDVLGERERH